MQVRDEDALNSRLTAMGYQPVLVEPANAVRGPAARTPGALAGGVTVPLPASASASSLAASERSAARLLHQLHLSFKAGMPVYQALTTVAGQVHEPALRQALTEIARGVDGGATLSEELGRYPRIFTVGDAGTIRAAEVGGFLPEAFALLAHQHEQEDNTRRRLRIWVRFFHSNVITLLLIVPLAFFFRPALEALDARPGLESVLRAFLTITLPGLIVYFGGLAAFYHFREEPAFAFRWHRLVTRLPVTGPISTLRANAVFTRTLQYLIHAAVPAGTAWGTAADAVPNRYLREQFLCCQPVVESSQRLSDGMQQSGQIDPADVGMVATGEGTGEVEQSLHCLANQYEEATEQALGASVVRGAVAFTTWALLLGAVGAVALAQGYYGTIFGAIDKAFGLGE
jgi:MSHA biogenesis protein MshG